MKTYVNQALFNPLQLPEFRRSRVPRFNDSSQILPVPPMFEGPSKAPKKNRPVTTVDGSGPNQTPRKTSPSSALLPHTTEGLPLLSPSTAVATGPDRLAPVLFALVTTKCWWVDSPLKNEENDSPWKSMIVRVDFPSYLGTPIFFAIKMDKFFDVLAKFKRKATLAKFRVGFWTFLDTMAGKSPIDSIYSASSQEKSSIRRSCSMFHGGLDPFT